MKVQEDAQQGGINHHQLAMNAMQKWHQGDVVDWRRFVYSGDARHPVTPACIEVANRKPDASTVNLTVEVEALVILTQTCDIVRSPAERRPGKRPNLM